MARPGPHMSWEERAAEGTMVSAVAEAAPAGGRCLVERMAMGGWS